MTTTLYMAQRLAALVMVPLVAVHLALMIYAVQGGLSAGEILSRTRGSGAWAIFYGTFVIAVSVHGVIGTRTLLFEVLGLRGFGLNVLSLVLFGLLLVLGGVAILAVTWP